MAPQLYLITPADAEPESFSATLMAVLNAAEFSALLVARGAMDDAGDRALVERVLFEIADGLSYKLRSDGASGRTITLKLRLEGFETHTRSTTLPEPVNDMATIRETAVRQFREFERGGRLVRLVGIRVSNLEDSSAADERQLGLFEWSDPERKRPRSERETEKVLDRMRERFGGKVTRATLLRHRDKTD